MSDKEMRERLVTMNEARAVAKKMGMAGFDVMLALCSAFSAGLACGEKDREPRPDEKKGGLK